jgi:hypothetical protein
MTNLWVISILTKILATAARQQRYQKFAKRIGEVADPS